MQYTAKNQLPYLMFADTPHTIYQVPGILPGIITPGKTVAYSVLY